MSIFPTSPGTCPSDIEETAEAYIMKRLSTADALRFAVHCLTCRPCAAAAEEVESFIRELKVAAGRLSGTRRGRPRLCSHASLTQITPMPMGGISAQMRFDVTVCEDLRTHQCLTSSELSWPPSVMPASRPALPAPGARTVDSAKPDGPAQAPDSGSGPPVR